MAYKFYKLFQQEKFLDSFNYFQVLFIFFESKIILIETFGLEAKIENDF